MLRLAPLTFKRSMITAQAVVYQNHGPPKDVLFTQKFTIDDDNLSADQIVVKTIASPVNPSDINQIQGVYPSKPEKTLQFGTKEPAAPCGNEGLFEVLKVGSNVKNFQPGDWVIPAQVNFGTWRTHALATEDDFIKLKKGLTVNQGATISVNPPTAYLMLTHYVKLTPAKDWYVQNGGTSAVGRYASQIGKLLGFNSISVVRDQHESTSTIGELEELGATKVITEKQNSDREVSAQLKQQVKDTQGQVKLALNCVGGASSQGIARKLDRDGLMLTYGGMSMKPVTIPTSLFIFKNITTAGFWVTELLKNDPELKVKVLDQIQDWYVDGKLKDYPSKVLNVGQDKLEDLHKTYLEGTEGSGGKYLVEYK
ncbi:mitochondrial 2-enoyl thioester reductase [Lodderomyces elongisporus]|uniref:mitochondrial 2-enoyl thioester reductase n=1 Tax=Lodderomyces elongisporus TaxID=36914 RepID=UPI002920A2F1|nr:mitochondrial 2-enoyl thioester reductase [Lodderomyces elongisporus]WLF78556.1 mitochondrial 2-enoyl thioester reductase [Lodderomyces elongisporus]